LNQEKQINSKSQGRGSSWRNHGRGRGRFVAQGNTAPTVTNLIKRWMNATPNTGIFLGTKSKICLEIPPILIEGMIKYAI